MIDPSKKGGRMFMLIPTAILLALSFFVLVVNDKVQIKATKIFGWVICCLLWFTAAILLANGINGYDGVSTGPCCAMSRSYCPMCKCRQITDSYPLRQRSMPPMMREDMPYDPHHPWRNAPDECKIAPNSREGMMMMRGGDDKDSKCPGMKMQGMTGEKQPQQK